jgi:Polyketide cyclase / dehydrase and lipid transport
LVDLTAGLDANCPAEELFAWVGDLGRYPEWLEIVPRAVPEDGEPGTWTVDLRGRLGPLARSKRLRMVRTVFEPGQRVRFERVQDDDREHSDWILEADVAPDPEGTLLTMDLEYTGDLWGDALLRPLLDEEVRRGKRALQDVVNAGGR